MSKKKRKRKPRRQRGKERDMQDDFKGNVRALTIFFTKMANHGLGQKEGKGGESMEERAS